MSSNYGTAYEQNMFVSQTHELSFKKSPLKQEYIMPKLKQSPDKYHCCTQLLELCSRCNKEASGSLYERIESYQWSKI